MDGGIEQNPAYGTALTFTTAVRTRQSTSTPTSLVELYEKEDNGRSVMNGGSRRRENWQTRARLAHSWGLRSAGTSSYISDVAAIKVESGPSESPIQRGFGWPSLNCPDCVRLEEVDEASVNCLSRIQGLFTP